jgi:chromosome segregation ATPase
MIIVFEDDGSDFGGGVQEVELDQGHGAMSSELELCVDRIRELRAELEFERRMRRKAEALVAELAEERRHGEAECRALREEAAAARAEEERRMLRVAELWREERVQMKLADARAAMEEKLREVHDAVAELHAAAAVAGGRSMSISRAVGKSSPCRSQQYGQQSPSRTGQPHRRV